MVLMEQPLAPETPEFIPEPTIDQDEYAHELWRTVADAPDYAVSNLGRVKRYSATFNSKANSILKPSLAGSKYYVTLWRDRGVGDKKAYALHELVAHTWLGECPPGCVAGHLNGDTGNNRLENIAYMSVEDARACIATFRRTQLEGQGLALPAPSEPASAKQARGKKPKAEQPSEDGSAPEEPEGNIVPFYPEQPVSAVTEPEPSAESQNAVEESEVDQVDPVPDDPSDTAPNGDSPLVGWTPMRYTRLVAGGLLTQEIEQLESGIWTAFVGGGTTYLSDRGCAQSETPEEAISVANRLAREWLMRAASELD